MKIKIFGLLCIVALFSNAYSMESQDGFGQDNLGSHVITETDQQCECQNDHRLQSVSSSIANPSNKNGLRQNVSENSNRLEAKPVEEKAKKKKESCEKTLFDKWCEENNYVTIIEVDGQTKYKCNGLDGEGCRSKPLLPGNFQTHYALMHFIKMGENGGNRGTFYARKLGKLVKGKKYSVNSLISKDFIKELDDKSYRCKYPGCSERECLTDKNAKRHIIWDHEADINKTRSEQTNDIKKIKYDGNGKKIKKNKKYEQEESGSLNNSTTINLAVPPLTTNPVVSILATNNILSNNFVSQKNQGRQEGREENGDNDGRVNNLAQALVANNIVNNINYKPLVGSHFDVIRPLFGLDQGKDRLLPSFTDLNSSVEEENKKNERKRKHDGLIGSGNKKLGEQENKSSCGGEECDEEECSESKEKDSEGGIKRRKME